MRKLLAFIVGLAMAFDIHANPTPIQTIGNNSNLYSDLGTGIYAVQYAANGVTITGDTLGNQITIYSIDVNGKSGAVYDATAGILIGSILNRSNTNDKLSIIMHNGVGIQLLGYNIDQWVSTSNATPANNLTLAVQGLVPYSLYITKDNNGTNDALLITDGEGNGSAIMHDNSVHTITGPYSSYGGLGSIDFGNNASTVAINTGGNPLILSNTFLNHNNAILTNWYPLIVVDHSVGGFGTISVNNEFTINAGQNLTTFNNSWSVGGVRGFNILSPVIITNPNFGEWMGGSTSNLMLHNGNGVVLNVGNASTGSSVTLKPTANSPTTISIGSVNTNHELTLIGFDSTNATGGVIFDLGDNAAFNYNTPTDSQGRIHLNSAANNPIKLMAAGLGSLGAQGQRLLSLDIVGQGGNIVDLPSYAKGLYLETGSFAITNLSMDSGAQNSDCAIYLGSNSSGMANISGVVNPTITLDSYQLNINSSLAPDGYKNQPSSLVASGIMNIQTTYNASNNGTGRGGRILVSSGASLDLHDVSAVHVAFTPDSTVPTTPVSFKPITTEGTGTVSGLTVPIEVVIDNTSNNSLGIVVWDYNQQSGTIYSELVPQNASAALINLNASDSAVKMIEAIATPGADGTLTATQAKTLTDIGRASDVAIAAERLVTANTTGVMQAEVTDSHNSAVTARAGTVGVEDVVGSNEVAENENMGAAAGSEEGSMYGAWLSSFVHKAVQKKIGNEIGYKVENFGATIGADTKVGEDDTLGFAITRTNSVIKHKEALSGNKATLNTNIFSLYSVFTLPGKWFIQSHGSLGFSRTKASSLRNSGDDISYSNSKYSSKSYSVQLQVLKAFKITDNASFIPGVGVSYNQFDNRPYTESGGATNFAVEKRKSYMFEGLVGAQIISRYVWGDYVIKPRISANAHIKIKEKQGKIHTSLDDLSSHVELPQPASSPAWYSIGAGALFYKGSMEFGGSYEMQLDKKYVGHQGSVKVKWNF